MSDQLFVPVGFAVPGGLTAEEFRLEPLGPEHNAADYAAWTASMGHIQATPGFAGTSWPHEMSLEENLRDLERHARDFAERRGFTFTVLSTGTGEPLIDLSAVSDELNQASTDADLVILEGMGRGVESNLNAAFSCDALNLAMLKDIAVAKRAGGQLYDVVCRFRAPS